MRAYYIQAYSMAKYVVAAVKDLFFLSKIQATANAMSLYVRFVSNQEELKSSLNHARPHVVIFDLELEGSDPVDMIRQIKGKKELKDITTVGFAPHLKRELRKKAGIAGCDVVLPRSDFSRSLPEILSGRFN